MSRSHPSPDLHRLSLFGSGIGVRLALAAGLSVPLWLTILWAMAA